MTSSKGALQELLKSLARRRRMVRLLNRFLTGEFYALLVSMILFLPARRWGDPGLVLPAVIVPPGLVLLLLSVDFLRWRPKPVSMLWDADIAHGTGHLLPASYNAMRIEETRGSAELTTALLRRGASVLPRIRAEITYPWRIPLVAYLIPIPALLILLLHLYTLPASLSVPDNPWLGYAEELREQAEAIAEAGDTREDRRGAALARELTALADMLESRPTEKETQERIAELLPELQDGMRRLGATDLITDPRDPSGGDVGKAKQEGTLREGVREEGSRSLLPDSLNSEGERGVGGEEPGEPTGDEPAPGTEETIRELRERLLDEGASREPRETDSASKGQRESQGSGSGPGGGNARSEEERARRDGESGGPGAGDRPSPDLGENESSRVAGAVERLLQLPRSENRGGEFSELFAREAPGAPRSTLSPEEAVPAFRRQVEAAVERADIPAELRPVVRDYFLRIGEDRYEQ